MPERMVKAGPVARVECLVEGDALKLDHDVLMAGEPYAVLSNLPYNVGTALFTRWLGGEAWPPAWTSLTLMF